MMVLVPGIYHHHQFPVTGSGEGESRGGGADIMLGGHKTQWMSSDMGLPFALLIWCITGSCRIVKELRSPTRVDQGIADQNADTTYGHVRPRTATHDTLSWNRLFHVKDDGFGEDRHVMQHHGSGAVLSPAQKRCHHPA